MSAVTGPIVPQAMAAIEARVTMPKMASAEVTVRPTRVTGNGTKARVGDPIEAIDSGAAVTTTGPVDCRGTVGSAHTEAGTVSSRIGVTVGGAISVVVVNAPLVRTGRLVSPDSEEHAATVDDAESGSRVGIGSSAASVACAAAGTGGPTGNVPLPWRRRLGPSIRS